MKLGLGAKQSQRAIKVNLGQSRSDVPPLVLNDAIDTDTYQDYRFENVEIKDGGSSYPESRLTLSSANQTEICFIEIEPVNVGGGRKLKVINGSGGDTYHDISGRIMITANPPAKGMVFDKWIGRSEPQYFEGLDQWIRSAGYIEDIYDSTTFVTLLDFITSVRATYKEK